jgi:hypothetical protein
MVNNRRMDGSTVECICVELKLERMGLVCIVGVMRLTKNTNKATRTACQSVLDQLGVQKRHSVSWRALYQALTRCRLMGASKAESLALLRERDLVCSQYEFDRMKRAKEWLNNKLKG